MSQVRKDVVSFIKDRKSKANWNLSQEPSLATSLNQEIEDCNYMLEMLEEEQEETEAIDQSGESN